MNIIDELRVLIGTELIDVGRAANMVWLHFTKDEESKYALHLQCPFRFETNEGILVTSGDMYFPATSFNEEYSDYAYDVQEKNLFDEKAVMLINGYYVQELITGKHNDLHIEFSGEISLNTFTNSSTNEEQWRFFQVVKFKTKEEREEYFDIHPECNHLVVTPIGFSNS